MTIPAEAVEAAAEVFCNGLSITPWEHQGSMTQDAYRNHARTALEAAAPFLMAQAWDVCAGAVEAATRMVAPDEITPMGARVINATAAHNPYRKGE